MREIFEDVASASVRPPSGNPWAIILAGGCGRRLRDVSEALYGYPRPKQFCRFDGEGTPLDHTIRRAERSVSRDHVVVLTNDAHHQEATEVLASHHGVGWVQQPTDRGTLPAVLLALLSILPEAWNDPVILMPSDHHVHDPEAFVDQVRAATEAARRHPEELILLGAQPSGPADGYGWILPDEDGDSSPARRVRRFVEKPDASTLAAVRSRGAMVNTFVVAGRGQAFAALLRRADPFWWRRLTTAVPDTGAIAEAYANSHSADFSHDLLARFPESLRVLPLHGVGWSDIGTPERLEAAVPMASHA